MITLERELELTEGSKGVMVSEVGEVTHVVIGPLFAARCYSYEQAVDTARQRNNRCGIYPVGKVPSREVQDRLFPEYDLKKIEEMVF